jgi:hypothetical protein
MHILSGSLQVSLNYMAPVEQLRGASTLADFSDNHRRVELFRRYQNELAPLKSTP